jgi:sugar/nucleoside kinase (ribokinase family)
VVGDIMADVVIHLHGGVRLGSDTDADISVAPGGSAANTAAWLADAGVATVLVGTVGDDALGRQQVEDLRARGVRPVVAVHPAAPTGTVVALVDAGGERSFLTDRGANAAPLPAVPLAAGGHLHLSGYALLDPVVRPGALRALAEARSASMSVSVDTASAAPLRRVGGAAWFRWTAGADICFANLMEGRVVTGGDDPAAVAAALASSYGEVVLKLGPAGVLWAAGATLRPAPAPAGVEVVDTVGAGDALAAGYLAGWGRRGPPLDPPLAVAMQTAARAVAGRGGRPPQR